MVDPPKINFSDRSMEGSPQPSEEEKQLLLPNTDTMASVIETPE